MLGLKIADIKNITPLHSAAVNLLQQIRFIHTPNAVRVYARAPFIVYIK